MKTPFKASIIISTLALFASLPLITPASAQEGDSTQKLQASVCPPVAGKIGNPTASSCVSTDSSFEQQQKNIQRLADDAARGDRAAAISLVKSAFITDSSDGKAVSVALANLARRNPAFLIAVLEEQAPFVRTSALDLLNSAFEQGKQPGRGAFESVLAHKPSDSRTVQAWKNRNR